MRMRCVALALLVWAAACGGSSNNKNGGSVYGVDAVDGTGQSEGTDQSDGTGPGDGLDSGSDGQDAADGTDQTAPQPCKSDADCTDQVCDCLGQCVDKGVDDLTCIENINCGSDLYCDKCAGVCRKFKEICDACVSHDECKDGACIDFLSGGRFCLLDCVDHPGCPQPGFECGPVDGIKFSQCQPLSGVCSKPALCESDPDCPYGNVCNNGQCGPGCVDDGECIEGSVCALFRCIPACGPNNLCPDGQECREDGHCWIKGGCLEPKDCELPATYCDLEAQLCKPGCQADFDCKASAKECVKGQCVDKGCSANYVCAFGQVCNIQNGQCEAAKGPHCEAGCNPQSETACEGGGNKCLELQDKDGKSQGNFCFVACVDDPLNKCPQGYQCQPLQDQDGNVKAELCVRDCTVNPI